MHASERAGEPADALGVLEPPDRVVREVPAGVVTLTTTFLAAWAGATAVIWLSEATVKLASAVEPKRTPLCAGEAGSGKAPRVLPTAYVKFVELVSPGDVGAARGVHGDTSPMSV